MLSPSIRAASFLLLGVSLSNAIWAQAVSVVRTTETSAFSPPSPDAAGVVFLPTSSQLLIADSEVNEMPLFVGVNLFQTNLSGGLTGTGATIGWTSEPTGLAYQPATELLFVTDDNWDRTNVVAPGPDGLHGTGDEIVQYMNNTLFGSSDAEGITFNEALGALHLVDGVDSQVYTLLPGANGIFDGVPPQGDDIVSSFSTMPLGVEDPEGIAWDSETGHLFLVGEPVELIAECTTAGELVASLDISAADPYIPAGLTFAPASSGSGRSLYLVDRGADNNWDPSENDGRLIELSLSTPPIPPQVIEHRVAASDNDAEERPGQPVVRTSTQLELVQQQGEDQLVGLRFTSLGIPQGATILDAWILFQSAEASSSAANLVIQAQASDVAPSFASGLLSTRPRTNAAINWAPPAWTSAGAFTTAQLTPNLRSVVQEVVSRPGWSPGNPMAFLFSGTGNRVATSFDGDPNWAPLLHVEFTTSTQQPTVQAGPDFTAPTFSPQTLQGSLSGFGSNVTATWEKVSGPGGVNFLLIFEPDSDAIFYVPGTYVLRLTADDGVFSASDEVTVTVN